MHFDGRLKSGEVKLNAVDLWQHLAMYVKQQSVN